MEFWLRLLLFQAIIILLPLVSADPTPIDISLPKFIISPYAWFTICDVDDPYNVSKMGGVEYTAVRDAFELAGYVQGVDFIYWCLPWPNSTETVYQAVNGDGVLGVVIGLPIAASDMRLGLTYSQETYRVNFGIGYYQSNATALHGVASWFFIQPFSAGLYAVLIVLPLFLAICLWIYEGKNQSLLNYLYHLIAYYFKIDFLKQLTLESRLLELVFQVYGLVAITLFTSQMINIISFLQTHGGVQTVGDLRGLQIVTDPVYVSYAESLYGRVTPLYEPIQLTKVEDFIYCMELQDIAYFLFETPIIEGMAKTDCRFSLVLPDVITVSYGIMWSKYAPQNMREKIDIGLMNAFANKSQAQRLAEEDTLIPQKCFAQRENKWVITIEDVYGVWLIWCLCLVLGIIVQVVAYCTKRYSKSSYSNFYDLEIRGTRERALIGGINSEISTITFISVHLIRKKRRMIVEDHINTFRSMQVPAKTKEAISEIMESELGLNNIPLASSPTLRKRRTLRLPSRLFRRKTTSRPSSLVLSDNGHGQSLVDDQLEENPFPLTDISQKISTRRGNKRLATVINGSLTKFVRGSRGRRLTLNRMKADQFMHLYRERTMKFDEGLKCRAKYNDHDLMPRSSLEIQTKDLPTNAIQLSSGPLTTRFELLDKNLHSVGDININTGRSTERGFESARSLLPSSLFKRKPFRLTLPYLTDRIRSELDSPELDSPELNSPELDSDGKTNRRRLLFPESLANLMPKRAHRKDTAAKVVVPKSNNLKSLHLKSPDSSGRILLNSPDITLRISSPEITKRRDSPDYTMRINK